MSNEIKEIFLEGKVKWASVITPKEGFNGDPEYSIDIEVSDEKFEALNKLGMSKKRVRKQDADGLQYLSFKKPVVSRAGKELLKPAVFDKELMPVEKLVGNGSTARIRLIAIPYNNKFGQGSVIRLDAVQILDLVEYKAKTTSTGFEGFVGADKANVPVNSNPEDII